MPIAAARVYSEGHRLRHLRLHELDDRAVQPHQFAWIGLVDPEPAELALLQTRFGLHPLAVEDALSEHPLPKVSVYGDQIFVAARTARLEGEEIRLRADASAFCEVGVDELHRAGDLIEIFRSISAGCWRKPVARFCDHEAIQLHDFGLAF